MLLENNDLIYVVKERTPSKSTFPCGKFIEDAANAPQLCLLVIGLFPEDLRSHLH